MLFDMKLCFDLRPTMINVNTHPHTCMRYALFHTDQLTSLWIGSATRALVSLCVVGNTLQHMHVVALCGRTCMVLFWGTHAVIISGLHMHCMPTWACTCRFTIVWCFKHIQCSTHTGWQLPILDTCLAKHELTIEGNICLDESNPQHELPDVVSPSL